jgi:pimeloyl-ACP methyl ester carboxylesterase
MMEAVLSADGTRIAFERLGSGPPLILVVGAFNLRATTAPLADVLQDAFTVLNYDRRGRGDSGDTLPYAVERELDDLDALITEAGGAVAVFGYSSGANLALRAAARGLAITELALYEPPFLTDGTSHARPPADLVDRLTELIAAGRRGDAVELFQTKVVGMPTEIVAQLRHAPFRPALEQLAHTLVYEAMILGDLSLPSDLLASIRAPTLVIEGEKSPPVLRAAARAVADVLPHGRLRTLAGETHDMSPGPTAVVLKEFLSQRNQAAS